VSTIRLRWQKIVNELRYLYGELDLTQQITKTTAPEFQQYYEEYCQRNNVDLAALTAAYYERLGLDNPSNAFKESVSETSLCQNDELLEDNEEFANMMEEVEDFERETEVHKAFVRVFKKLAMHFHPDRLSKDLSPEEREHKMQTFKKALKALEERRYFVLLDLADQYGVETPTNYKEQVGWMRKEAGTVNQSIISEKQTYNYMFAECDTQDERDDLMRRYLHQLFGFIE